jgi:hypothetical protein
MLNDMCVFSPAPSAAKWQSNIFLDVPVFVARSTACHHSLGKHDEI